MTYGYMRISCDKSTVENQRFEIETYCAKHGITIDKWIEETVSGAKDYNDRKLGGVLRKVKKGDIIITCEISRLGRNLLMIMEILSVCMKKGCIVQTIKDGYRLGDDMSSKVLAFAFGLSAEIERKLISMRTKEALARLKANGVKLGRPEGSKSDEGKCKLFPHKAQIYHLRDECGRSYNYIAKKFGVSRNTVIRFYNNFIDV